MAYISALKVTQSNGVNLTTAFEFTEHNRSSIPLSYEQIEMAERMANGYMRKFVTAKKMSFSISWNDLPSVTAMTVDGKGGAQAIKTFYDTYYGKKLTIELKHYNSEVEGAQAVETIYAYITSFSYDITKRISTSSTNGFDRVNLSIGFVEA